MMIDPYLIKLNGGLLDGYRQSVNYILLDTRLEMPGTLPFPDSLPLPPRAYLYDFRQASIEILDGLPTMVLYYDFIGIRVGVVSAVITKLNQWKDRFARSLLPGTRSPHDARFPKTVRTEEPAQPNRQLADDHRH